MPRPIEAIIDKAALRHNLRLLKAKSKGRFLWAVSKANAYGHGLTELLEDFEVADGIAVLDIEEAVLARKNGWRKPILLIEGFFDPEDLAIADKLNLETLIHSPWQLKMLAEKIFSHPLKIYLKLNSGMNRLGFAPAAARDIIKNIQKAPHLFFGGIVSHYANADYGYPYDAPCTVDEQFQKLAAISDCPRCLANSAAILWRPDAMGDAVRAGIAIYGVSPSVSVSASDLGLIPVMTLRSRIIAIQNLEKGDAVGYGSRYIAPEEKKIAIIACGYADGYPRQSEENRHVWFNGKKLPIIGNVSMDMITLDISGNSEINVGDYVELWGKNLSVNEVADLHGSIGYELLANLNKRVPRKYLNYAI